MRASLPIWGFSASPVVNAKLLIVQAGTKQYEIPYAEAYLKSLDLERKQIRMQLPEGLLELDAPLTIEEKKQQGKR